ncbi:MAG TPA: homoserine kinase, partial [Chloroflexota bacterium]|nr:homoserine kinase [Chloroflexota bacterium]
MTERMLTATPDLRVVAPATSANLGPGFDSLALALDYWNTIDIWLSDSGGPRVTAVQGEGRESLERDDRNLVLLAMRRLAAEADRRLPDCLIGLKNNVPLGRGMGSSAAAITGGLVAAAALLNLEVDPRALLPVALGLEGHPDNVVAALYGGFTVGVLEHGTPRVMHVRPAADLRAVVLAPDQFSSTLESRQTLPESVSRADAVFNAGRCALLGMALCESRWDLLAVAMGDRLHQPQRARGFPYLNDVISAAISSGAHGAALSGSGSSVIALCT